VKKQEADQIVAAMRAKAIPVTYALDTDEGHGFARPNNRCPPASTALPPRRAEAEYSEHPLALCTHPCARRLDFYGRVEAFLSEHLGGESEPAVEVDGSSVQML
jgi:hypothetical protein